MNTLTPAQRERVLSLLREGKTLRRIQDETGHRRETIAAYGRRAGVLGGVASLDAVREPASICEPHRDAIAAALENGTSLRALHAQLVGRAGFTGSYSALKQYVRTHLAQTHTARGTVMMLRAA